MSDITPMAAMPSEVNYGRIRANFVAFIADDNGNVLEEVPLEGNVILTPTVGVLRFPSTSPPRTAVIQTLQCPVIGGILYPPGTPLGGPFPSQTGVAAVASDQPAGLPTTVQWTASFSLENTSAQPNPVTFEVPSGGVVDLTTVMPATPEPGTVVVVSTVDRERAEDAAAAAAGSASNAAGSAVDASGSAMAAASSATAAATSATNAATSASAAASSASNAASSAASISWAGLSGKPAVIAAGATAAVARTAIGAADASHVALQDTGLRSLLDSLPPKFGPHASGPQYALRRIGTRVEAMVRLTVTEATAANPTLFTALPVGFRSAGYLQIGMVPINGVVYIATFSAAITALTLIGPALPVGATVTVFLTWPTNDAFPIPANYPGTPA